MFIFYLYLSFKDSNKNVKKIFLFTHFKNIQCCDLVYYDLENKH